MGDKGRNLEDVELRDISSDIGPHTVGRGSSDGLRQRSPTPQVEESHSYHGPPAGIDPIGGEDRSWCLAICGGSFLDLVLSFVIFCTSVKYSYRDTGPSLACLAMQCSSHWISSILLIFRFRWTMRNRGDVAHEEEGLSGSLLGRRRRDIGREQGLGVTMGLLMVCSSGVLIFKGAQKMKFWDKWYDDHSAMDAEAQAASEWLAWWGFGVYVFAAVLRYLVWQRLRIRLVYNAFCCSVVSLLFLFVLGIAATYETPVFWKAEPIAAFVLAAMTLFEGMRVCFANLDNIDMLLRDNRRP